MLFQLGESFFKAFTCKRDSVPNRGKRFHLRSKILPSARGVLVIAGFHRLDKSLESVVELRTQRKIGLACPFQLGHNARDGVCHRRRIFVIELVAIHVKAAPNHVQSVGVLLGARVFGAFLHDAAELGSVVCEFGSGLGLLDERQMFLRGMLFQGLKLFYDRKFFFGVLRLLFHHVKQVACQFGVI